MVDPRTRITYSAGENTAPANGTDKDDEGRYLAVSPCGNQLAVPKELFIALSDFMKTRKCAGSITIQFRTGEIVCVEAVAKKTYRNP
jgi:hypothetical protein